MIFWIFPWTVPPRCQLGITTDGLFVKFGAMHHEYTYVTLAYSALIIIIIVIVIIIIRFLKRQNVKRLP